MNGSELHQLASRLFPICRSITGEGVRETLAILAEHIPLELHSVSSGTQVFDWTVPDEWKVREAWIANRAGERVIDFANNNLHLLQYSTSFRGMVKRSELDSHLHSLPAQPDLIPYKTSYYQKQWGFCLSDNQRKQLVDEEYEVRIDTELAPGVLDYGELLVPGLTSKEIIISTHICHPSLANDNLSGILVALNSALHHLLHPSYFSIRFIFIPGTIGAITWLAMNQARLTLIKHGLVLTGLGAGEQFCYKQSRAESAEVDGISELTLRESGLPYQILPFSPYGYDERQYNSPGIGLSVGCLMRLPHGSYPEYHTSADNLDFLKTQALEESSTMLIRILENLSANRIYRNLAPFCEPQLGRRGLYAADRVENLALLWVLNLSDGAHSVADICGRSRLSFIRISAAAIRLRDAGLLECVG